MNKSIVPYIVIVLLVVLGVAMFFKMNPHKEKKMVFTDPPPWCTWCKKMKSTTLADPAVKDKLSKEFVVCYIDTDKDKTTARKYNVRGIPAYMLVSSEEKVLSSASGYKPKEEFVSWLAPKNVSLIDP